MLLCVDVVAVVCVACWLKCVVCCLWLLFVVLLSGAVVCGALLNLVVYGGLFAVCCCYGVLFCVCVCSRCLSWLWCVVVCGAFAFAVGCYRCTLLVSLIVVRRCVLLLVASCLVSVVRRRCALFVDRC